jgi:hypothetical protein
MFTTGSKLYFGIAAAAFVAGIAYLYSTDLEFLGTIVLFSLAVVATFLGSVIVAFRDADVAAPTVEAASAVDAEGYGRGPRVSPSIWPVVGAFGVGLVAIGLVYDRRWFVGGIVVLVATTVEWAVQAWSDRASDDPEYNHRVRGRLMHPLEFPILGALAVGLVIFGFSRVMLAIPKGAAVVVFIGLGAIVLVAGALLSTPRKIPGVVVATVLVLGAAGILTAGIAGATKGERGELAHHEAEVGPDKKTSNAVGDKASVAGTVAVTEGMASLPDLVIPRSAPSNLLFVNESNVPRQLVVVAGSEPKLDEKGQPVKDAAGNAITVPITFHTDYIGTSKSQVLTVTMPKPGVFEYRAQAGDNVDVIAGKVTVP